MRVRYSGPHTAVDLPLPTGRTVTVAKGQDIDLGEHLPAAEARKLGKSLTEQETWSEAKANPVKPSTDEKGEG